jgi:hypothetical protein
MAEAAARRGAGAVDLTHPARPERTPVALDPSPVPSRPHGIRPPPLLHLVRLAPPRWNPRELASLGS